MYKRKARITTRSALNTATSSNNQKENITMSKRKESKVTPLVLSPVMSKSDNQHKCIMDASFITESFLFEGQEINSYILSIARYMNEHLEVLDDTHSILFIALENLKNHLLATIVGCDPKPALAEEMSSLEVNKYILSRIQSVLDNPSSIKDAKKDLLDILRACIEAIKSYNNSRLDRVKNRLGRQELIEKEIALFVTSEGDNQPERMKGISTITSSFKGNLDINSYLFSIVKYMNEHIADLDATHTLLISHMENLKSGLLERSEGYDPKSGLIECLDKYIELDNYIIGRLQSVIDNPSSLEKDRLPLLYTMQDCIVGIKSDNNSRLDELKVKLARHEWVEKEILLSLGA